MIDWTLFKLLLKKDWVKFVSFLVGIVTMTVGVGAYFPTLYHTQAARDAMAVVLQSPAMTALFGPSKLARPYTTAGLFGYEMLIWVILVAVVANLSISVANSRGDEERGIVELLLARAMSRFQWLNTLTAELLLFNGILTALNGFGLMLIGMPGHTIGGDWLFAGLVGLTGLMFGLISLVMAQVFGTARNTTIGAYLFVTLSYLVMVLATSLQAPNWTWAAIVAWGTEFGVYSTNQRGPVALLVLGVLGFYALAASLLARRDLDAGLLPDRPGAKRANWTLKGPLTLLVRTQGLTGVVWLVMIFVFGYAYGSAFNLMDNLAQTNQVVSNVIAGNGGHTVVMNFLVILTMLFGILSAVPGIMVMNHLFSDEKKGYLESLHAKPVGRLRLFSGYAAFGWVLSVAVLAAGLLGMYVGGLVNMTHPLALSVFGRAFLGMVAPMTVMVLGQGLIIGALPKLRNLIWLLAYLAFFDGYFGHLLKLPTWLGKLTPYGWMPKVPVAAVDWTTSLWLLSLAVILILFGMSWYRRRDLEIG
ncbi:ABC transporter permease [Lacticaseibacillus brantae]|uniref:ABC transporter, permease protein n=1 Tax=Lacticaseibacillus brantae DSM 23927 TaxID=1423727 RepID=A0A0R2AXC5_9LACO|nr:hypothetical protein [Lacticaseibacillus brantae]KRM71965.1 ABC transporter, permease protein [Lacticaseibacillus brantae DSM 23927]